MLAAALALLAGACDRQAAVERHRTLIKVASDEAATKAASGLLVAVIERKYDQAREFMAPPLQVETDAKPLAQTLAVLPSSTDHELELIGSNQTRVFGREGTRHDLTFQARVGARYVLARVRIEPSGGIPKVTNFKFKALARSLVDTHAFTLASASPLKILVLLVGLLALGTCVVSAVLCVRTPIPKRKWLWLLYVVLGFGALHLDWTTGAVDVQWIRVQLLALGMSQSSPYDPWVVMVSLPVGALHFLLRRRSWLPAARDAQPQPP